MSAERSEIRRYRRKPVPGDREEQIAVRYTPGHPLGELADIARKADPRAEMAEAAFPSGTVLIVRYTRFYDDHPSRIEYEVVEPGKYLAYDPGEGFLYHAAEANWRDFYDEVT